MTPASASPRRNIPAYLRLVRFQHTLFALPFAYVGAWLAAAGFPGWSLLGWVTLAMVGARTFAMAVNRILDARIDAANPRTAEREIPKGILRSSDAAGLALVGLLAFGVAGVALNPLTAVLLPVAAIFMGVYPLVKRFSWLCHLWLGLTIGAAAAGGYIAVAGSFAPVAWWLWLGVGAWIAGFDVIYALLDEAFDRAHGVHSIPARFGAPTARKLALLGHGVAMLALVQAGLVAALTAPYYLSLALVAGVLLVQHVWVARRGAAVALQAFDANLVIGVLVFGGVVVALASGG